MLATFIIGLREGLEAALIVSIVATFLKQHGHSLRPMWVGVGLGVALSVLVGVAITVAERALSQTAQEAMEGVIGLIAAAMVTTMVLWMSKHSRSMKHDLEQSARLALASGTSRALVLMAFLAIVKEGFETAVLLLATFQAAGSAAYAAVGALLGLLGAVVLGVGLYRGGLRLDLARFFRYTSIFLVLVAGGLLVTSLRKFHEAGWLNAGQQRTVDLGWLAPVGSVRGTVVTGVLGISADPRLIQVLAYTAYVVPMLAFVLWPHHRRPGAVARRWIQATVVVGCLTSALALVLYPTSPVMNVAAEAPIQDATGSLVGAVSVDGDQLRIRIGSHRTATTLTSVGDQQHFGLGATAFTGAGPAGDAAIGSATLTLADVSRLNGGRFPVGITPGRNPGPFHAAWHRSGGIQVWTVRDAILDAADTSNAVVTLSGGGLANSRTITIDGARWSVTPGRQQATATAVQVYDSAQSEIAFWTRTVPALLTLAATVVAACMVRNRRTRSPAIPKEESSCVRSTAP